MEKFALIFLTFCTFSSTYAFSIKCSLGAQCISSQGTKIPVSDVIKLLDTCDEFTESDIGRNLFPEKSFNTILKMADKMGEKRGLQLKHAHFAFYDDLLSSPLAFERKSNYTLQDYVSIKKACNYLHRDFHNERKWTK